MKKKQGKPSSNKAAATSIKTTLSLVMVLILAIPLIFVIIVSATMTRSTTREDVDEFNKIKAEAIERLTIKSQ